MCSTIGWKEIQELSQGLGFIPICVAHSTIYMKCAGKQQYDSSSYEAWGALATCCTYSGIDKMQLQPTVPELFMSVESL